MFGQLTSLKREMSVAVCCCAVVFLFACNTPASPVIPVTGDTPVAELACTANQPTVVMQLGNGDQVRLPCGVADRAILEAVPEETLPVALARDYRFVSCLTINVLKGNVLAGNWGKEKAAVVSFVVPNAMASRNLKIFYWNLALKSGMGDWSEVPITVARGRAETMVDYPGTFILAAR
jgi:hypothetical protein